MRRRRPERRKILPDPVYKDLAISKFINFLMIRRPPRSTPKPSSAASDVYKRQFVNRTRVTLRKAELGFFGVVVYTRVHTPLF